MAAGHATHLKTLVHFKLLVLVKKLHGEPYHDGRVKHFQSGLTLPIMGRRIFHAMNTELDIGIGGMTCASCVARVERGLQKVPGVQKVAVNLATESARIMFDSADLSEARLRRAIRDAGYEPRAADAAVDAPEESAWAGFAPIAMGPGTVGTSCFPHGGGPVRPALDAARLGAVSAGHARAVHPRRALLQSGLARRQGA
jgi:copper chaperone CopZ